MLAVLLCGCLWILKALDYVSPQVRQWKAGESLQGQKNAEGKSDLNGHVHLGVIYHCLCAVDVCEIVESSQCIPFCSSLRKGVIASYPKWFCRTRRVKLCQYCLFSWWLCERVFMSYYTYYIHKCIRSLVTYMNTSTLAHSCNCLISYRSSDSVNVHINFSDFKDFTSQKTKSNPVETPCCSRSEGNSQTGSSCS